VAEPTEGMVAQDTRITCPACGSVHSADGRTLFERSPHLRDLEDAKPKLAKLTKIAERLERQLQEKKEKVAPAPAAVPAPAAPKEESENAGRKKHGKYL
jgi:hypothetical protein